MGKESFLLYKSLREPAKILSDEELGCLFRAILDYQCEGIEPDLTQKTQWVILYFVVKNQFHLDQVKYEKIVERNINNGAKGGRKRKPSGTQKTQWVKNNPLGADNDNEKDTKVSIDHPLINWLKIECPTVTKMKKALTAEEATKLLTDFTDKEMIKRVFLAMENHAELHKKFKSANLTFRNWATRDTTTSKNKPPLTSNPKSNSGSAL